MKIIVGLTGSIACGKSFVSNTLSSLGYDIIDTDKINHEILDSDIDTIKLLANEFNLNLKDNKIDRKELGAIVFNDKAKLLKLNSILHPRILLKTKEKIEKSSSKFVFIDAPLLFEAKFDKLCDKTVCVYTTSENQIERLISRDNVTREFAIQKINSQMSQDEKIKKSNYKIFSDVSFDTTKQNIKNFIKQLEEDYYA